jgi:hypothetical protein
MVVFPVVRSITNARMVAYVFVFILWTRPSLILWKHWRKYTGPMTIAIGRGLILPSYQSTICHGMGPDRHGVKYICIWKYLIIYKMNVFVFKNISMYLTPYMAMEHGPVYGIGSLNMLAMAGYARRFWPPFWYLGQTFGLIEPPWDLIAWSYWLEIFTDRA